MLWFAGGAGIEKYVTNLELNGIFSGANLRLILLRRIALFELRERDRHLKLVGECL